MLNDEGFKPKDHPMIRPTVGRVVWYHPGPNDPPAVDASQPHAAMISHVENERRVNLLVVDSSGLIYRRLSAPLAQDADKPEKGGAQWMPFQVGQANADYGKRLDALEAENKALSERVREFEARIPEATVHADIPGRVSTLEETVRAMSTPAEPPPPFVEAPVKKPTKPPIGANGKPWTPEDRPDY